MTPPTPPTFVTPTQVDPTLNVLIYGAPGSGKTVGATTAPGPVVVLNAEGPGALRKSRELHGDAKIREIAITGKADLDGAYLWLRDGGDGTKTVVVDTVGEVYRILLEEQGGDTPSLQHYGHVNTTIERFVRALRDLPMNVVLVCHEELISDGTTGETIRQPVTGGKKLPAQLMAQVDVVAYTKVVPQDDGAPEYMAQLVNGSGRLGKDRSGRLGAARPIDITDWVTTATTTPRKKAA